MVYQISREIGIDAGHRVPTHGSKCKNLHGHRYKIQAICESGRLHEEGEQQDMTLDFGFLKEEMMKHIDEPCDHGLILWINDPLLPHFLDDYDYRIRACSKIKQFSYFCANSENLAGKLYVIADIPTAETLAKHWYHRLLGPVHDRSEGLATIHAVKVWETPNCWATYTG